MARWLVILAPPRDKTRPRVTTATSCSRSEMWMQEEPKYSEHNVQAVAHSVHWLPTNTLNPAHIMQLQPMAWCDLMTFIWRTCKPASAYIHHLSGWCWRPGGCRRIRGADVSYTWGWDGIKIVCTVHVITASFLLNVTLTLCFEIKNINFPCLDLFMSSRWEHFAQAQEETRDGCYPRQRKVSRCSGVRHSCQSTE